MNEYETKEEEDISRWIDALKQGTLDKPEIIKGLLEEDEERACKSFETLVDAICEHAQQGNPVMDELLRQAEEANDE